MPMPMPQPDEEPYEYIPLPDDIQAEYLAALEKETGSKGRAAGEEALRLYKLGKIGPLWKRISAQLPKYEGVGKPPTGNDILICMGFCGGLLLPPLEYAGCVLACIYKKLIKQKKKRRF